MPAQKFKMHLSNAVTLNVEDAKNYISVVRYDSQSELTQGFRYDDLIKHAKEASLDQVHQPWLTKRDAALNFLVHSNEHYAGCPCVLVLNQWQVSQVEHDDYDWCFNLNHRLFVKYEFSGTCVNGYDSPAFVGLKDLQRWLDAMNRVGYATINAISPKPRRPMISFPRRVRSAM